MSYSDALFWFDIVAAAALNKIFCLSNSSTETQSWVDNRKGWSGVLG